MNIRPFRVTSPAPKKKVKIRATATRSAARHEEEEEEDYESAEPNMKLSHAFIGVLILHVVALGGIYGFNYLKNRDATAAKANAGAVLGKGDESAKVAADAKGGATKNAAVSSKGVDAGKHEVAPGETLSKIASRYGVSVDQLEKANGLTANSVLRSGQMLVIPKVETKVAQAPAPAKQPNAQKASDAAVKPVVAPKVAEGQAKPAVAPKTDAQAKAPVATKPASEPKAETKAQTKAEPKADAKAVPKAADAGAGEQEYVVVSGDNPYSIAKRFHVSYQKLVEVNGIEDPTKIRIGQKLKIPGKAQ